MCLYTDYKTPLIATEPIRVWKRLNVFTKGGKITLRTPYQYCVVNVGDSLKALDNNAKVQEVMSLGRYAISVQGVHGYITMPSSKSMKCSNEIITEWEIPAGAKYWIGTGYSKGEIAATEMKFVKVCD